MANAVGTIYRWMDCSTHSLIPGETNQSFIPTVNGSYAVVISSNGCTDTSACFMINSVGIENSDQEQMILVFPNPTDGVFSIYTHDVSATSIEIYNVLGEKIEYHQFSASYIDLSSQNKGIYYLKITTDKHTYVKKIILEK
jgi:hypothetical protein